MGQPMGNNPLTQNVWRSRGAKLLDEIGPAILITHGDGLGIRVGDRCRTRRNWLRQSWRLIRAKCSSRSLQIFPWRSSRWRKTIARRWRLYCVDGRVNVKDAPRRARAVWIPIPNRDNTALKLADQGCFWVGVQRKQMTYGAIAMGQMYVQYMIPAEKRYPYPVIMVHGGGGQGTHMMGIGGRPGWVHYFVQAGYSVYWLDRPSYGRSPYHPDALGPSHLPNVPPYEPLVQTPVVFNTAQWPGPAE